MTLPEYAFAAAQGAARATLFAGFGIAGVGKLLGCTRGVRPMCGKAALDLALALLGLLAWQLLTPLAGATALAVGAGGWARERITRDPVCRCFGVMNGALHRYRNHVRGALALAGLVLLASPMAAPASLATAPVAAGALAALAAALLFSTHAFGAAMLGNKPIKLMDASPLTPALSLQADQPAGLLADGSALTVAQLLRPGQPLAILFSSPGCPQCETVKAELAAYRTALPFPLRIVDNGRRGGATDLHDADGALRRSLAVVGTPTLVVFDAATLAVTAPFAVGADAIRRQVMGLLLRSTPAAAPDRSGAAAIP